MRVTRQTDGQTDRQERGKQTALHAAAKINACQLVWRPVRVTD